MPNTKLQQYRVLVPNDLVEKKNIKAVENHQKHFQNLKKKLGLDLILVTSDEQDIIGAL